MMGGSNLPHGTSQGDPNAPWNQSAPICSCGTEKEWDDEYDEWVCPDCYPPEDEPPTAEDIAYEKAQASEEWQRRGGGGL